MNRVADDVVPVVASAVAAVVTAQVLLLIAFMVALAGLFVTSGIDNSFVVGFSL